MRKTTSFLAVSAVALSSALAVPAFAADKPLEFDIENPDITYCGGSTRGNYYKVVGKRLREQLAGEYTLGRAPTNGTADILDNVATNQCTLGAVQADGLVGADFSNYEMFGKMYDEYVHLICSADSGIEGVRDLRNNSKVTIGYTSNTSGGSVTWKGMGLLDKGYNGENGPKSIPVPFSRAASKLRSGSQNGKSGIECFIHVTGLGDDDIESLGERLGDDAVLVPFNDWDFNDATLENGERLYTFTEIPEGTYNSLGNESHWRKSNGVETISVGAVLIGNADVLNGGGNEAMVNQIFESFDYALRFIEEDMAE